MVWICKTDSLLALHNTVTRDENALELFRSKLCIVGFDWIAAATVDSSRATSNPSHIPRNSTDLSSWIFSNMISKTFPFLFPC